MLDARDKHVREQWIKVMELRLVREELVKCQRSEGINALAQCKELSERYLDMLKTAKVEGWRIVDTAQFKSS
ncbi:NADH-ubiquinone oxidoreductase 12 kda subunit mitochondrial precursor [Auriculariales sp. MPI-PUGE-AT-0066]|nr:NADH-ubiquinone oxidoreductase 12 kda subunit mitochondrial precursor [Auriculariales sp. MPI-PUGE-AT-0066]